MPCVREKAAAMINSGVDGVREIVSFRPWLHLALGESDAADGRCAVVLSGFSGFIDASGLWAVCSLSVYHKTWSFFWGCCWWVLEGRVECNAKTQLPIASFLSFRLWSHLTTSISRKWLLSHTIITTSYHMTYYLPSSEYDFLRIPSQMIRDHIARIWYLRREETQRYWWAHIRKYLSGLTSVHV